MWWLGDGRRTSRFALGVRSCRIIVAMQLSHVALLPQPGGAAEAIMRNVVRPGCYTFKEDLGLFCHRCIHLIILRFTSPLLLLQLRLSFLVL
jgi:hypothetical protein